MAKYAITATRIVNFYTEVEADSPDDAVEIAREMREVEFDAIGGEFTIDYAEEISE